MLLGLGTRVYSNDSRLIGTIDRLIVEPTTGVVERVVVRAGILLQADIEVSPGKLYSGPGDTLMLSVQYGSGKRVGAVHCSGVHATPPPATCRPKGIRPRHASGQSGSKCRRRFPW